MNGSLAGEGFPAPTRARLASLPRRDIDLCPPPEPLTSLVGRAREIAELPRGGIRLLTLTGPGGAGKTRLAMRVMGEVADLYPDGRCFVPLAVVREPDLLAATIARALPRDGGGGVPPEEQLHRVLAGQRVLLVLDNLEQVIEAAPPLTDLTRACSGLAILATSRVRLNLTGERCYPVPSLAVREPADAKAPSAAASLFVERAEAVAGERPDLGGASLSAIETIRQRLDGLPLAIELAAARVPHLPLPLPLDRLERCLPLLTGGAHDLPARLRTMRDAIAWSYDLLTPPERELFRRAAVFE